MPSYPQAILFDLDGTLVDSAPDIAYALASTFVDLGIAPRSDTQVRQWVGNGIDKLLHRAITDSMDGVAEDSLFTQIKTIFFEKYKNDVGHHSEVFKGVRETLDSFLVKDIPLGCVTNKDRFFTLILLEKMNIKKYFKTIIGGDDVKNKKPSPDALIMAAKQLNVPIDQCLMIGDSKTDVVAANNANIDIICVDYGYAQGVNLSKLKIKALISNFQEIEGLLIDN